MHMLRVIRGHRYPDEICRRELQYYGQVHLQSRHAINRGMGWYAEKPDILSAARQKMMKIDNSWETSAKRYIEVYQK